MSLVTRGLGPVSRLVTTGLGGAFVLTGFTGCVIISTLKLTSLVAKTVGLNSISIKVSDLTTSLSKSMDVDNEMTSSTDLNSKVSRDLSCR